MALTGLCCPELRLCPSTTTRRGNLARAGPAQIQQGLAPVSGRPFRGQPARAAQPEQDTDSSLSGEWPVNWSLASYEDVGEFFQQNLFKDQASPGTTLQDVMSTSLKFVTPDERLDSLSTLFNVVSPLTTSQTPDL